MAPQVAAIWASIRSTAIYYSPYGDRGVIFSTASVREPQAKRNLLNCLALPTGFEPVLQP